MWVWGALKVSEKLELVETEGMEGWQELGGLLGA